MPSPRKHPDWIKLGLTNSLYGGAFNSRLVMNIREDKGYTYSPRSSVNPLREYGYFSVSAAVRNDVVAASLTEIFYELDKLRALPVPEAELADARNYVSGVFSLGLATQDGLLSQLATVALNDLPDDYPRNLSRKSSRTHAARFARHRAQILRLPPICKSSWLATARKSSRKQLYSAILRYTTPTARISANYHCYLLIRLYLLASRCYALPQTNNAANLWPPDALFRRGRHLGRNKKAPAQANQHQHRKLRGAPASSRNRPRNRRKNPTNAQVLRCV